MEMNSLKSQMATKDDLLDEIRQKNSDLHDQHRNMQGTINDLSGKLSNARAECARLQREVGRLEGYKERTRDLDQMRLEVAKPDTGQQRLQVSGQPMVTDYYNQYASDEKNFW